MFRNLIASAVIALAPISAQAITVKPDDNVLGNEITDIDAGGAPIIGDGYLVVRDLRTFIFDIDLAKHDLDLSLVDAEFPGNYLFTLKTSAKIVIDGLLSYVLDEFLAAPTYSYSIANVGVGDGVLEPDSDELFVQGLILDIGDTITLELPFDGAHGANGNLQIDAEPAAVPLPGALALSLTALAGLGMIRRRQCVAA